ncbi:hypothetical protein ACFOPN_06260 [Xanthomonas hyacinthi]|nr:hypothetical protein [Xanthomonas hyacinthi]
MSLPDGSQGGSTMSLGYFAVAGVYGIFSGLEVLLTWTTLEPAQSEGQG